jgi:NADP-dependent 3-hydroxy acid dehydrogenase YdfG
MAKTIVLCGFGTGISTAIARKFGAQGFRVALVARNAERLASAVKSLASEGIEAAAFPADLADPSSIKKVIGDVQKQLGPITVLQWNAYASGSGDLLQADAEALQRIFQIPVSSLLLAVQAALPDLRQQQNAAVLVTNGGLGLIDPKVDAMAVAWGAMDLAVANAAKHKLVGVLSAKLAPEKIYVGEVVVLGTVKGTAWDNGSATLEAADIAKRFWDLYSERTVVSVNHG